MGKQHVFSQKSASVTVTLPDERLADRGERFDTVAEVGARRARDNSPLEFRVLRVDVEVDAGTVANLPADALDRPPTAIESFSEQQRAQMSEMTEMHWSIAEAAFDYWLRILRWTCDDHRLGRERVEDNESGWSPYIVVSVTGRRVWASPRVIQVPGGHVVTLDEWETAQSRLNTRAVPPVYIEFKHDAQHRLELGDYRRAVIDFAVACETFIRTVIARKLPGNLMASAAKYIEKAAIHQCMPFFADCLDGAGRTRYDAQKGSLRTLFDRRNVLMHSGSAGSLRQTECAAMLTTTNDLLTLESHVVP